MGEAQLAAPSRWEVRIKAGTRDGQRIRLAAKQWAGAHGGAGGDLYVINPDRRASRSSGAMG